MLAARLQVERLGDGTLAHGVVRPRRAHLDPRFEIGNLLLAELTALRHLQLGVGVAHRFDEQAFLGLAGRDHWPAVAALERGGLAVQ